jgi:hypothetical protein
MHDVESLPAVVGDPVQLFKLVHQEYVDNPIWEIQHVELIVDPLLVGVHCSRVTVDLDAIRQHFQSLEILLTLECRDGGAAVQVHPIIRQRSSLSKRYV